MKLLDQLEKRFGHLAISNVVMFLIVAQVVMYAVILTGQVSFQSIQLSPGAVLSGECWRLFSFIISPPWVAVGGFDALFLVFFWFIFWFMASNLEGAWGAFRLNVYLLLGFLFSIAGGFVGYLVSPDPSLVISIVYVEMSLFFAFATLFPNHEFMLMMILPVKVKWLALVSLVMLLLSVVGAVLAGQFQHAIVMILPFLNYIIFFKSTAVQGAKSRQRRAQFERERQATASEALHACEECGATDRSHPDRDYRYKMVDGEAVCICSDCREQL
ncbi:MAG: hypothetical protein ACON4O_02755 [Lentimonas sp.]